MEVIQNGDQFTWSPLFKTNGPQDEPAAVVTLTLPVGISFVSAVVPKGSFAFPTWDLGLLKVGFTYTPVFTFEVSDITQLGDITAVISGDLLDPVVPNNTKTLTVSLAVDPVATAVAYDYGCLCGDVSFNDTLCSSCTTVWKLVPASEVNLTIDYFNEATGEYRVTLIDATLDGSFDYYIQCECDGLPAYVQNTVTHTVVATLSGTTNTNWFNNDFTGGDTQAADRAHDQGDYETDLTNIKRFRLEGTGNEAFIEIAGAAGISSIDLGVTDAVATSLLVMDPTTAFMQNDDGTNVSTVVTENGQVILDSDKQEYIIFTTPTNDDTIDAIIVRDPADGRLYLRDQATILGTPDTNFFISDITQTGNRVHDADNKNTTVNDIDFWLLTGHDSEAFFTLQGGAGFSALSMLVSAVASGTQEVTVSNGFAQMSDVTPAADSATIRLENARITLESDLATPEYYISDGGNNPPDTPAAPVLMALDLATGQIQTRTVASLPFSTDKNFMDDNLGPQGTTRLHNQNDQNTEIENIKKFQLTGNNSDTKIVLEDGDTPGLERVTLQAVDSASAADNAWLILTSGQLKSQVTDGVTSSSVTGTPTELAFDSTDGTYKIVTAPTNDPTKDVVVMRHTDGVLYLRDVDSIDTNFFADNLVQGAHRSHDQAGYTTIVDNVGIFTLQANNANTYIKIDDNSGDGILSLQAENTATTEYTKATLDSDTITLISEDDTAAPTKTSSVVVDNSAGVKLLSTDQLYYIGDATDYPTEDNALTDVLVVDTSDGRIYTRSVASVSNEHPVTLTLVVEPHNVLMTATTEDWGIANFVVADSAMAGLKLSKVTVTANSGGLDEGKTLDVRVYSAAEATAISGGTVVDDGGADGFTVRITDAAPLDAYVCTPTVGTVVTEGTTYGVSYVYSAASTAQLTGLTVTLSFTT